MPERIRLTDRSSLVSSAPLALPPGVSFHEPLGPVPNRTPDQLTQSVREAALELGFVALGFAACAPFAEDARRLDEWRTKGRHGQMRYLEAPSERASPWALLASARSVISVALPHARVAAPPAPLRGRIARYALGADYHRVIKHRLRQLADRIAELTGPVLARACVDTAPLLEHAVAQRAGVGFTGRHTLTIVPGVGSYVLLGELLVTAEFVPDSPQTPRCGSCTRCLDACPTGAFVGSHELDATRCISYLTIELRGPIPWELRPLIGDRVFGCDVCQEVCPYNRARRAVPATLEMEPRPALVAPQLTELLWLGSAAHRRLVRGTALERVHRVQLARNAVVALGNSAHPEAVAPVMEALERHPSPLVRGHAAWAAGRLSAASEPILRRVAADDPDDFVRGEATRALNSRNS